VRIVLAKSAGHRLLAPAPFDPAPLGLREHLLDGHLVVGRTKLLRNPPHFLVPLVVVAVGLLVSVARQLRPTCALLVIRRALLGSAIYLQYLVTVYS